METDDEAVSLEETFRKNYKPCVTCMRYHSPKHMLLIKPTYISLLYTNNITVRLDDTICMGCYSIVEKFYDFIGKAKHSLKIYRLFGMALERQEGIKTPSKKKYYIIPSNPVKPSKKNTYVIVNTEKNATVNSKTIENRQIAVGAPKVSNVSQNAINSNSVQTETSRDPKPNKKLLIYIDKIVNKNGKSAIIKAKNVDETQKVSKACVDNEKKANDNVQCLDDNPITAKDVNLNGDKDNKSHSNEELKSNLSISDKELQVDTNINEELFLNDTNINDEIWQSDDDINEEVLQSDQDVNEEVCHGTNINEELLLNDKNINDEILQSDDNINEALLQSDQYVNEEECLGTNINEEVLQNDSNINERVLQSDTNINVWKSDTDLNDIIIQKPNDTGIEEKEHLTYVVRNDIKELSSQNSEIIHIGNKPVLNKDKAKDIQLNKIPQVKELNFIKNNKIVILENKVLQKVGHINQDSDSPQALHTDFNVSKFQGHTELNKKKELIVNKVVSGNHSTYMSPINATIKPSFPNILKNTNKNQNLNVLKLKMNQTLSKLNSVDRKKLFKHATKPIVVRNDAKVQIPQGNVIIPANVMTNNIKINNIYKVLSKETGASETLQTIYVKKCTATQDMLSKVRESLHQQDKMMELKKVTDAKTVYERNVEHKLQTEVTERQRSDEMVLFNYPIIANKELSFEEGLNAKIPLIKNANSEQDKIMGNAPKEFLKVNKSRRPLLISNFNDQSNDNLTYENYNINQYEDKEKSNILVDVKVERDSDSEDYEFIDWTKVAPQVLKIEQPNSPFRSDGSSRTISVDLNDFYHFYDQNYFESGEDRNYDSDESDMRLRYESDSEDHLPNDHNYGKKVTKEYIDNSDLKDTTLNDTRKEENLGIGDFKSDNTLINNDSLEQTSDEQDLLKEIYFEYVTEEQLEKQKHNINHEKAIKKAKRRKRDAYKQKIVKKRLKRDTKVTDTNNLRDEKLFQTNNLRDEKLFLIPVVLLQRIDEVMKLDDFNININVFGKSADTSFSNLKTTLDTKLSLNGSPVHENRLSPEETTEPMFHSSKTNKNKRSQTKRFRKPRTNISTWKKIRSQLETSRKYMLRGKSLINTDLSTSTQETSTEATTQETFTQATTTPATSTQATNSCPTSEENANVVSTEAIENNLPTSAPLQSTPTTLQSNQQQPTPEKKSNEILKDDVSTNLQRETSDIPTKTRESILKTHLDTSVNTSSLQTSETAEFTSETNECTSDTNKFTSETNKFTSETSEFTSETNEFTNPSETKECFTAPSTSLKPAKSSMLSQKRNKNLESETMDADWIPEKVKRKRRGRRKTRELEIGNNCVSVYVKDKIEILTVMENIRKQSHFKSAPYKCEKCSRTFQVRGFFQRHKKCFHKKSSGNNKCEFCRCRFKSKKELDKHTGGHEKYFICRICSQMFVEYKEMRAHARTHENNSLPKRRGRRKKTDHSNDTDLKSPGEENASKTIPMENPEELNKQNELTDGASSINLTDMSSPVKENATKTIPME